MKQSSFPILMFHDLGRKTSATCIRPDVFRQGLIRLDRLGFVTLGLMQVAAKLRQGEPLPDRSFCITFDDGFRAVYEHAFDVLQQLGMTATVFLSVGSKRPIDASARLLPIDGGSMLSWREIRQMHRAKIQFGAHTLTHPDLTGLSFQQLEQEICGSKTVIEDALGTAVDTFAYPFGRYDERSLAVAREHFACACTDKLGLVTAKSDIHTLERVDGYYLHSHLLFGLMGRSIFPWYIRARAVPRRIRRALGPRS